MIAKLEWTQGNTQKIIITESHNGSSNQQWINNNRTTVLERIASKATGGLKWVVVYWLKVQFRHFKAVSHESDDTRLIYLMLNHLAGTTHIQL